MATKTGLAPSTINSWKKAGIIPAKHQQLVIDKGAEHGIKVKPSDFFEPQPRS